MSVAPLTTRASAGDWLQGARPRTLPVAVIPVAVGTAVALAAGRVVWWHSLLALVVALFIQIGTNFANDYSDGIRGTDTARIGPLRLVAGDLASPRAVRLAALSSYSVAALAGLALALATTPYLLLAGGACLVAGWCYTGGPRPYGYAGLGELFVFVFFGLVAVVGTAYVSIGAVTALAAIAAVPVGLLSVSLLVANNLRDIRSDGAAGKRTLAVRLGDRRTRAAFLSCIVLAFVTVGAIAAYRPFALLALLAGALAVDPVRRTRGGATGNELVLVLGEVGRLILVFGLLLALGIAL